MTASEKLAREGPSWGTHHPDGGGPKADLVFAVFWHLWRCRGRHPWDDHVKFMLREGRLVVVRTRVGGQTVDLLQSTWSEHVWDVERDVISECYGRLDMGIGIGYGDWDIY